MKKTAWKRAGKSLILKLTMKDFPAALAFIRAVAKLAEAEDHHPDIHLTRYRNLRLELTTHDAGALTERDYRLAAKIDKLPRRLKRV
ncbi:MAG: 4a-hydroxytetrahydrobiopterin dehydratase [Elusimicrobia bacterium]|nr:4a-hydroxytetrahydrobiopterin dehydratase [Elusimicrobiota bacterium]